MSEQSYAFIKNNLVENVAVFDSPSDELLNVFKEFHNLDLITPAGENAKPGSSFDGTKFWLPQPYPSWIKDEDLNEWVAPISQPEFDPENPIFYIWNEEILNWELII